jgi:hypothetical protein
MLTVLVVISSALVIMLIEKMLNCRLDSASSSAHVKHGM